MRRRLVAARPYLYVLAWTLLILWSGLVLAVAATEAAPAEQHDSVVMEVSAYCHGHTTADGSPVRAGVAAAGPGVPFGTAYWVPGVGRVVVHDRGGAVHDGALDLYMPSCRDAILWGRRWVLVTLLEWPTT